MAEYKPNFPISSARVSSFSDNGVGYSSYYFNFSSILP